MKKKAIIHSQNSQEYFLPIHLVRCVISCTVLSCHARSLEKTTRMKREGKEIGYYLLIETELRSLSNRLVMGVYQML